MKGKGILALLAASLGASAPLHADTTIDRIVECTSRLLGAPVYSVEFVRDESGRVRYQLTKTPLNPTVEPMHHPVETRDVIMYGETFILTSNQGRSGYAHLYFNGNLSVIDINLFQTPQLNSSGPLTNFHCKRVGTQLSGG